jgi:amino acid transporter
MPDVPRPFKVPLFPVTPLLFVVFCGYLLYSSLSYTGKGALLGAALLIIGLIFYLLFKNKIVARKD